MRITFRKIVGTVNELLIDQDGQIGAVIISTGGIIGMGEKDLAMQIAIPGRW